MKNNKLSDQIEEFISDNMINIFQTHRIDKLPLDQYFPYQQDVNINDLKIDEVSKYSITLPKKADFITKLILSYFKKIDNYIHDQLIITDATAGVGGNVLSFCKYDMKVIAVELDKNRFEYLKHNTTIYGYKIDLYNNNYLDIYKELKQDIIYIDPPWGGLCYKEMENIILYLGNKTIEEICIDISLNKLAKLIVLKLPYNYDINNFKYKVNLPFNIYNLKNILLIFIYC